MRFICAAFRWASGGAAAGSDRRCESGCGAHVPWVCASFAPGLNKTMLYARLLHSWTDNMRVINAPWDFDLAKVRSAVGGEAAENTRTRRMQRGRAAQRTRGVPSTRALYVAWHTCCTPHNVRMPYTFFSTSPERIRTPRAATGVRLAAGGIAAWSGARGRHHRARRHDQPTADAEVCTRVPSYSRLCRSSGRMWDIMCRWVADHIPGAELLVQQPGWGHAHCFIAEVG